MADHSPSPVEVENAVVQAGGDYTLLRPHVERVMQEQPELDPGEAVEALRARPAMWPAFEKSRQPHRARMSTSAKAAFIGRHGVDAYLALPYRED